MNSFLYKRSAGITALAASMTDFTYKKHAHEEYAIGVTLRGIQEYRLNGSVQLSHQNGVMLFSPEQAHDGMAHDKTGLDYVMLYIEPHLLLDAADKVEIFQFSAPIVYNNDLQQRVIALTDAILSDKDEALCSELFINLTDSLVPSTFSTDYQKEDKLIRIAKEMLQADLSHVVNLEEISKELHLSRFQFIRLFKAHTGISPYQYYLNAKIERAKHLIQMNRDIYSAVAACGFVDLAHLNKHFKSVYGTTAYEYMSHL